MENKEIESVRTTGTSRRVGIRFVSNLLLGDLSPRIYQAKKKKKKKRERDRVCVKDILESLVGWWDRRDIIKKVRKIII